MSGEGEPAAVLRKKALLRLLCRREAERLGLRAGPAEARAEAERFRRAFALEDAVAFAAWLAENGLEAEGFAAAMRDVALVEAVEARLAAEVAPLVPSQAALGRARLRLTDPG